MALQSTSSSAHPFSSSSIRYEWKYDVFISFRGHDTRYGFTGNLYNTLLKKGIHTFFDAEELQSGEEITPALLNAIQNSRIAIIVLSSKYAHSSFCLEELVHILDCIKGNGRLVLPIFYEVDPSDVRCLKEGFGEAMAKHEKRYNKVDKWKKALHQVANLSGYHFKHGDGYQHKFIENIVEDISRKISHVPLPVADFPVGLESRVPQVISLLEMESTDGVHMVGIHGIGGIGKTTLALAIYNVVANNFEGVCFLESVREKSQKHGLMHLQKDLLCKILGKEGVHIIGVNEGTSQIQCRLGQMKVLLVLDDVDDSKQLQAIAEETDWFGGGSGVIITTRDTHLLKLHGVERTYYVQGLDREDSFKLLIWKAFKTKTVCPSYADVINRAITYASGHPLALELIGSNLFGKEVQVWESALDQFEKHLDDKIHKILRVSFDALGRQEQSVFLDIACCFKGHSLEKITDLLQAHYGRSMKYHIEVLLEKSLIKTIQYDKVTMHDLIEDMGKEIDNLEKSAEMPGKLRRLWFYKDIVKVLEDNQGSSTIEIIYLEFPSFKDAEVKWDGTAFKEMKNLKTLIIKNGCFSKSPKHLPNSLRVLEWRKYPSEYFPPDFQPEMLCILKLPDYVYPLPKLDSLSKASKLVSLKEIPDLSGLHSLQELSLEGCRNLVTVDNSVGFLPKLQILNAYGCEELSYFPPVIQLPSLEDLYLSGCSSLEYFPEIQQEMENVKSLHLSNTGIKDLPFSFRNLSRLKSLYLGGEEMCKMPSVIGMMPQLSYCHVEGGDNEGRVSGKLEEGFQGMFTHSVPSQNLTSLFLENTNLSNDFFPLAVAWFPNVERLDLRGNNFTILPECIQQFCFLKDLRLKDCPHLRDIRGLPPNLEYLSIVNCKSLSPRAKRVLLNQTVDDIIIHVKPPGEKRWNHALPHCEQGWNHVEVTYEGLDAWCETIRSEFIVKEIGMHVVNEKDTSIVEDIRFTDPYKMTELIVMMMMVSLVFPNHKKHPLLLVKVCGHCSV
ncbi:hypothetical protein PIB30_036470 [Stylosanthes scabra]|uniref:TIR domain-containing protein n=1 Tax=Stylosanthes scabra TaxID=79078 RepID=A0ABU6WDE2_9FABA|nr:hypothetical protein [Stylosanthes scabra]